MIFKVLSESSLIWYTWNTFKKLFTDGWAALQIKVFDEYKKIDRVKKPILKAVIFSVSLSLNTNTC